jgi:hypothetical protein
MIVHDSCLGMGGERISSTVTWAEEFDGPSHFLTTRSPTGATLLKRFHLELLGHTLIIVPYLEWEGCKGASEREQHMRGKLAHTSTNTITRTQTLREIDFMTSFRYEMCAHRDS